MLDALTEPFAQGIGRRALVEVVVLGSVCGPLGTWVVLYRHSYAAESLAHAMLPGLVIAVLVGLPLGIGAAGGLILAAVAVSLAGRERTLGPDVAVAVAITALFGAGTLLALVPAAPPRLAELLFGDPLSVSVADLAGSAAVAAVVLAALAAGHRRLSVAAFDRISAPSLGARPAAVELGLLVLLALTTLVAVQALGNLLVVALIVAPAAAALRVCSRLGPALAASAALAIAAGLGGIYVSHYLYLAAGASIALVAVGLYALSLPFGRPAARRAGPRSPVEALSESA